MKKGGEKGAAGFEAGRMHESGLYFFCPRCGLSFPHPPWLSRQRYLVGYGYCCYCLRYVPIEGGDRKGVVRLDAEGRPYTVLYDPDEREWTRERWDETVTKLMRGEISLTDEQTKARNRENLRGGLASPRRFGCREECW